METIDPKKAARVWQRVQGHAPIQPLAPTPSPTLQPAHLIPLIRQERLDAAIYAMLARQPGPSQALLKQLAQQEYAHLATLKGLYTLLSGQPPKIPLPQVSKEPAGRLLRRCYGQEMHTLARYEALSENPEYGRIFRQLAQQEQEHCRRILMILGRK